MAFSVIYPHTSFVAIGANTVKPRMLERSVRAEVTIVTVLDRVRVENPGTGNIPDVDDPTGRTWAFIFVGAGPLSGPETTALNAIVAAHTGVDVYDPATSVGGTSGQVWGNITGSTYGWTTPPGAGGGAPGGATTEMQYNNAGAFGGATGYSFATSTGLVVTAGTPVTPSTVGFGIFADEWKRPRFTEPNGVSLFDFGEITRVGYAAIGGGSASLRNLGLATAATVAGSAALSAFATTTARTAAVVVAFTPLTTANAVASGAHALARLGLYTAASHSALRCRFSARFAMSVSTASNARFFAGLCETVSFSSNPTVLGSTMGTRMGIGFGDDNSAILQWITTQAGEANSVVSTGITVTNDNMYHVEMATLPASATVVGTLWRQTTAGGAWAAVSTYSYDSTANLLAASGISLAIVGGNGATSAAAITVYAGFMMAEMR